MVKKICQTCFLWLILGGVCVADKPHPWQMNFQDAATPVMESIYNFHHMLLIIIFAVAIFVAALLVYVLYRFRESKNPVPATFTHNTKLEIIWTAVPVLILVFIAIPSLKLLKLADKLEKPELTLKVTGHQWYWEYDYPESDINFNSYMKTKDQLEPGDIRMLAVDKEVILPVDTDVRILVTAADVLHSWAVPAFGVKQDTVPGRLRETWVRITKPGTYYGQCSELCGQGHGYMPIAVKAVSKEEFKAWLDTHKKPAPAPAAKPDGKAPTAAKKPLNAPATTPSSAAAPADKSTDKSATSTAANVDKKSDSKTENKAEQKGEGTPKADAPSSAPSSSQSPLATPGPDNPTA